LDNQMEEEFDNRPIKIEYAEKMQRLLQNDDFKALFSELYVEAYMMTNVGNMWMYDDPTRRRFLEKSLSRSHFLHFIDEILEDGRNAILSMREDQDQKTEGVNIDTEENPY